MFVTLSEINQKIADPAFLASADAEYRATVKQTADAILERADECPIVLISGPSGSGKTTTAKMLEHEFDSRGHQTHVLSMDNYFHTLTEAERELALQDKIDLESPERVDKKFLNAQLDDIIACRPVNLPKFKFKTNTREDSGKVLHRKSGEIVILEGIHALNPAVITIPKQNRVGIYVSVRTRVKTPDARLIHPEYIRLIRRMHRDFTHRGRSYIETLKMYPAVQRGESKYIMPYKHLAEFEFDTFVPYELNVFKYLDYNAINEQKIASDVPELIDLLKDAVPLDASLVPNDSLLCEFIGGSKFKY